ncbi:hypothetical protein BDD12DRAFT_126598 [Trichophaea hybrida]|nr:hypothetical protein BDD12DRAFT_126598 [Trichophaea hybrida]
MMRSDNDTSRGSPHDGGGDSWHDSGRGRCAGSGSRAIPLAARVDNHYPPPARYRPRQQHDAHQDDASNTEVSLWGARREYSGMLQHHPPPPPPPQPPPPTPHPHPPHQHNYDVPLHRAAPRDNFTHGAALAARLHFPSNRPEHPANDNIWNPVTRQPQHGDKPRSRRRGESDPLRLRQGNNGNNSNSHSRPTLKAPMPPDHPLLGTPTEEIVEPDMIFESYRNNMEICDRAQQYIGKSQPLHHLYDVFDWWYTRVVDRLDRKEYSKIELDPHEKIISKLSYEVNKANKEVPDSGGHGVVNYFADHMIPKNGFTVEQVEQARKDPNRWKRRDERENKWMEESDGIQKQENWRAENVKAAREMWEAKLQAINSASHYDSRKKHNDYRRNRNRNSMNLGKHKKETKGSGRTIIGAKFDSMTRISKGGGPVKRARGGRNSGGM